MSDIECAICLEHIEKTEHIIIPNCLHKYHSSCLQKWENTQNIKGGNNFLCPECNTSYDFVIKSNYNKDKLKKPIPIVSNNTNISDIRKTNKNSEDLCACTIL